MKLLFLCTLFLAPLLVLAKVTLTSFSYSKGVVTMTVKKWSDAPPTYTIQLAHDGTTTDLLTGIETKSGEQTVNLPPVPVGSGYTVRLVSAIAGDPEVYYTSKSFSVKDGDFASVTASSVSAASTSAASSSASASTSGSDSSASGSESGATASSVFTTYTDANGSVVTALATATGTASGTETTTFTTYTDSAGVVSTLPVVPVTTVTSATVVGFTTTDSAGSVTTFSATSIVETTAPLSAASAAATTSANAAASVVALPSKVAVAVLSCVFAGAYLFF